MKLVLAYITVSDRKEAEALGKGLLEERLAACINIVGGMHSQYWWKGKIESADETILIAKTDEAHTDALTEYVKKHHSYSCPCVLWIPVSGGNADYLKWLSGELN